MKEEFKNIIHSYLDKLVSRHTIECLHQEIDFYLVKYLLADLKYKIYWEQGDTTVNIIGLREIDKLALSYLLS